jgi:hypothetical protein
MNWSVGCVRGRRGGTDCSRAGGLRRRAVAPAMGGAQTGGRANRSPIWSPDRGADPHSSRRRSGAGGDPDRVVARPRRPSDPEGTTRPAGRVRLSRPSRRQPRRHRCRPRRAHRQPTRRAAARSRHHTHQDPFRSRPPCGRNRPRLRRSRSRHRAHRHRCAASRHPCRGRRGLARQTIERARPFRHLVKWRTGIEGRISHLKHGYCWNRTQLDGIDGARTWCGLGVLAHNAVKIAALVDERDQRQASTVKASRPRPRAGAPPQARPPVDHAA